MTQAPGSRIGFFIHAKQLVPIVDAKARRFTISQGNTIAPGFNKEERELSFFFMYKAGKVPCLIEQGDGKKGS